MHRLGPRFNQHAYMELLQEVLPQLRLVRPLPIRFQQDNSPVHTARAVRSMLQEEEDVQLVPWVARGPDISPIENLWGRMTDLLTPQLRDRRINADQLWLAVQQAWEKLTPEYCRSLAESVPRRLQAVVEAEGDWSGY